MLRPVDIHEVEFKRVMRGYSAQEVNDFLRKIVSEYELVYQENQELKERIKELKERVRQYTVVEDSLQEALSFARQTAQELRQGAERQAKAVVADAQAEAEALRVRTRHEAELELERLRHLLLEEQQFQVRMREMLTGYLEALEQNAGERRRRLDALQNLAGGEGLRRGQDALAGKDKAMPDSVST